MSRFDKFWAVFPKKEGKKAAKDKWVAKKLDEKAGFIIAHVEVRAKRDKKWLAGYTPMPLTFLNQERWDDEYETVAPKYDSAKPDKPFDPLDLSAGVKGMARAHNIDHTGLTEDEVCAIVWAKRYGGLHEQQVRENPKLFERFDNSYAGF